MACRLFLKDSNPRRYSSSDIVILKWLPFTIGLGVGWWRCHRH